MRFWLTLLVTAALSVLLPFGASAQSLVSFDKAQVNIWPEYDRPGVLVINYLTISAKSSLPAEVTFLIPKAAGTPNAVAMLDIDGRQTNLNYTTAVKGDWIQLSFTAPVPELQIEYYDPSLTKTGTVRNFEYHWPGEYAVGALSVQILQPVNATDMKINPSLGSGQQRPDGLTFFAKDVGELKAGTPFTIRFSYDKKDDTLTVSSQQVQSSAPIDSNTPGRLTFQEVLPWVLGGLGLLLVVGGVTWYYFSSHDRRAPASRRRHAATVPARETRGRDGESGASTTTKEAVYCHQCGRRANAGDVFCRTCGTKLRL